MAKIKIDDTGYFTVSREELTMLFTYFLKYHKCYHSFKEHAAKYVVKCHEGFNKLKGLFINFTELNSLNSTTYIRSNVFMRAFNWQETPEGPDFWCNLHNDWERKFLDRLFVDDEERQGVDQPWMEHVFKILISR